MRRVGSRCTRRISTPPGCFDDVFKGCHGVCHVSHVSTYSDQEYVRRVCDHVIESVNASGTVGRVIVTSSIAAVLSEADIKELVRRPVIYEDRYPDESNPKRTPERGQGYSMGKVIAERAFADAAAQIRSLGCDHVLSRRQSSDRFSRRIRKPARGSTSSR